MLKNLWSPTDYTRLAWDAQGCPYSPRFNDVYFSRHNGLAESRAVFLDANGLPQRWADFPYPRFTIGELGFGTGLNFLATWQAFARVAPACRLCFVSLERYPLDPADITRALAAWPELAARTTRLLACYPPPRSGWHCLPVADKVELKLWLGEAEMGIAQWDSSNPVDAWYLDGFAPARNPALWHSALFQHMVRVSRSGATFGTFTAAGHVRRAMQDCGFKVEKIPGFGGKRERLRGWVKI